MGLFDRFKPKAQQMTDEAKSTLAAKSEQESDAMGEQTQKAKDTGQDMLDEANERLEDRDDPWR